MRNLIICFLLLCFGTSIVAQEKGNQRKKIMNDEKKELANIAGRSFSWLTGTSSDNDYISVGKIAHYFGTISLRLDSSHSLSRGGFGKETFSLLNARQRQTLLDLLDELKKPLNDYRKYHERINRELEKLLRREYFDDALCLEYSRKMLQEEGKIGYTSANVFSKLYHSLSSSQLKSLEMLRARVENKEKQESGSKNKSNTNLKEVSHEDTKEIWNLCTRFTAWVTGEEKDNKFTTTGKTSQHFGFVSVRVGSGHGITRGGVAKEVMELLRPEQLQELKNYVKEQQPQMEAFLDKRFELVKELKHGLNGNISYDAVLRISENMGEIEGIMTIQQAKLYIDLRDSLTQEQILSLFEMRAKYLPSKKVKIDSKQDLVLYGEKVFNSCVMCHSLEKGKHLIGPSLNNILNKPAASMNSYNYSDAMKSSQIIWTKDVLESFLENPKKFVPGTIMPFSGIENDQDRKALILYLESLKK